MKIIFYSVLRMENINNETKPEKRDGPKNPPEHAFSAFTFAVTPIKPWQT